MKLTTLEDLLIYIISEAHSEVWLNDLLDRISANNHRVPSVESGLHNRLRMMLFDHDFPVEKPYPFIHETVDPIKPKSLRNFQTLGSR